MKVIKLLAIVLISTIMFSCESEEQIQSDVDKLKSERVSLTHEKNDLTEIIRAKEISINLLNEQIKEKGMLADGKTPRYILKFKLKQSRVSLDLMKHAKDAMNAIEFELPVDKEFYDAVKVGSEIVDEFRTGSLIINTDFSSWNMTVTGKAIK